jgi:hypothetical protein
MLADRYRVERDLGAGDMATVYLARDHRHDRNPGASACAVRRTSRSNPTGIFFR